MIRVSVASDVPRLVEVGRAVFGPSGLDAFVLRQFIDLFGPLVGVETDGESIDGFVVGGLAAEEGAGWMVVLAVAPAARRRGIGRHLTTWLLNAMVSIGAKECRLTVSPTNTAALSLYRRAGFQEIGSEADYYGPGEDRLVLAHTLLDV